MSVDEEGRYRLEREVMVQEQLVSRGITDSRVLQAFHDVPRHLFVPAQDRHLSYQDGAIKIGPDQSISQPFVVAFMLEQLELAAGDKVLEIGTGSGYQTALISNLSKQVYSLDIDAKLVESAKKRLKEIGVKNAIVEVGDGWKGLAEQAPFDKIIISAACSEIPRPIIRQLSELGRMILPLGADEQDIVLIEKRGDALHEQALGGARFVPLKKQGRPSS